MQRYLVIMGLCVVVASCYGNGNESPSLEIQPAQKIGSFVSQVGSGIYGLVLLTVYAVGDIPFYLERSVSAPDLSEPSYERYLLRSSKSWAPANNK